MADDLRAGGWPGEPGVPLNPERDGWHLVGAADGFICAAWSAVKQSWALSNAAFGPWIFTECEYLGPVLTPADVEARERAAWQAGAEAMREQVAQCLEGLAAFLDANARVRARCPLEVMRECASGIREMPTPEFKP